MASLKAAFPIGLYSHQAQALQAVAGRKDICLATATASGKSLVFMAASLDLLLKNPFAKVVALYPAKALIQDQLEKWHRVLDPFGIGLGFIDGSVPVAQRAQILASSRVVLLTPDVTHAWLMNHANDRAIRPFLRSVRLLILDEAHVYDGVFGTNMAYFLRRFAAVTAPFQLIASTATIGNPAGFLEQLTGRQVSVLGPDQDGSSSPEKTIVRVRAPHKKSFECMVELLVGLSRLDGSRFLAFGDSRKMVERVVAATLRARNTQPEDDAGGEVEEADADTPEALGRILPYRAGYEAVDRRQIQRSLSDGALAGLVSTSALEMGIDIGEIDTVVLLNTPPSVKSFRQRLGRAGRRRAAVCIVLDDEGTMGSLTDYLARTVEPSWLYLDNRYIQYANALCAAAEMSASGKAPSTEPSFASLPPSFVQLVENELNPTDVVASDLYPLKQRGQGGAHREFPLRSATEQDFRVTDVRGNPLGTLSMSQALREAYPGAVHYYMARPYRVIGFVYRTGEIKVMRCRHWTTRPQTQTVVFPRFQGGILNLQKSDTGFVAEVELQVSERVVGFVEQRGSTKTEHVYGPGSEHYQKPIGRFFQTTGVCWYFPDRFAVSEAMAARVLEALCVECGIQCRDLGIGVFRTNTNPALPDATGGICIYDATNGSLRLTQILAERFSGVLDRAVSIAEERQESDAVLAELRSFGWMLGTLTAEAPAASSVLPQSNSDWVTVIASGQRAIYASQDGPIEVTVAGYRYTPQGLLYELVSPRPGSRWLVAADAVSSLNGDSLLTQYNVMTGESKVETNAAAA
ncbi:MAG: DEAD/DEAH box helicase [Acidobacteriota bacterium]|nr:DEAD/DEAH box helicase [Acidobacteriota bacterium]